MSKIRITSTVRPCLMTTPSRSKTMIIGGTITHVDGEPWGEPYVAVMPGGRITLDDIEWIDANKSQAPVSQGRMWMVPSSDSTTSYIVTEQPNGRLTCNCNGFHYRKTCRHVNEVI